MSMSVLRILHSISLVAVAAVATGASAGGISRPGCLETCGNVTVPYPFGIGTNCSVEGFEVTCNQGKPFLAHTDTEIINISVLKGQVKVLKIISYECYNQSGRVSSSALVANLTGSPFRVSNTRNLFTAVGCGTSSYIVSYDGREMEYASGCMSFCDSDSDDKFVEGECSGVGCCQTSIPGGLNTFKVVFDEKFNHSSLSGFNPCSYAFVADKDWYRFSKADLRGFDFYAKNNTHAQLVLDWTIGNKNCTEARKNSSEYACIADNSDCINSDDGLGYTCNFSSGYQGNPYIKNGCQDIDECAIGDPCYGNICINTPGNFTCKCNRGKRGDAYRDGGCKPTYSLWLKLVLGFLVVLLAIGLFSITWLALSKVREIRDRKRWFEENGGFLLRERIGALNFKIFTLAELNKVTDNFRHEIGRGGSGAVYKGTFGDKIVAVKRSKISNQKRKEEFVNELVVLSQINHMNVIKILGCCFEVEVPMLVCEFISNGTLHDFIHNGETMMPLNLRVRIAMGIAEALAYMHSGANPQVLHRDIKPSNVLLTDDLVAKVTDFGSSSIILDDVSQGENCVPGTYGYVDRDGVQKGRLTDKSDVYSFAVLLLELFTRRKVVTIDESGLYIDLVSFFRTTRTTRSFHDIMDDEARNQMTVEESENLAWLLEQCLSVKGEDRPTMKEVASRLQAFKHSEDSSMNRL